MSKHDLGTYHVRVVCEGGEGFIMKWETGSRYTHGTDSFSPLFASRIGCIYSDESDLFETIKFMFEDGNYSCDCNLKSFIDRALQQPDKNYECGEAIVLKEITAIRPDGSECRLLDRSSEEKKHP